MRLIDADALMQSLGITDMDCDKCEWHDSEWNNCKRGGEFEDACCAIENAPTITPEQQWIPCGVRLPEENKNYLVTVEYENGERRTEIDYRVTLQDDEIANPYWIGVEEVLAWRELPEPWKGEV